MPLALVLSSHVAASRVGAKPVELALHAAKIDSIVVPTTLLGRHPGWGAPGGGAVPEALFSGMLEGVQAQGLFAHVDAVLTGYFASAAQVEIAAKAIQGVKAARPAALIAVDPILGDDGALYVKPEVAHAIAAQLLPLADVITPNLFELGWLSGAAPASLDEIAAAARALKPSALVTSVAHGEEIGALLVDGDETWLAMTETLSPPPQGFPKGTGDVLFGVFIAGLIQGLTRPQAAHRAVAAAAHMLNRAKAWGAPELPIVAAADGLLAPSVPARLSRVA